MAGGSGERLRPLTDSRAKPAVPFGGKFRLIDFTLSNCINSGIRQIFVLTQYKSASLNRHLQEGWGISSSRLGEYIYPMPAQQKLGSDWYRGTADAVRQNLDLVRNKNVRHILVLSGDHVYKMDYSLMLAYHRKKNSSLTVSAVSVPRDEAAGRLGVLEVDSGARLIGFEEKPMRPKTRSDAPGLVFASMGVYIFTIEVLLEALAGGEEDFGTEIIPAMIKKKQEIYVYPFESENKIPDWVIRTTKKTVKKISMPKSKDSSYWRDVGTIESYFQSSMDLLGKDPPFNLYAESWPIRTQQESFPPSKCIGGHTCGSIISDGCLIKEASAESSVLSPRIIIERGARIENSVIFDRALIGPGARIRRTIVDKDVVIQPGATLGYDEEADRKNGCTISESGITVVPKASVIKSFPNIHSRLSG
jgi:glucose-1-phosphate adenylyltransferase